MLKRKSCEVDLPLEDAGKRVKVDGAKLLQVFCRVRPKSAEDSSTIYETTNSSLTILSTGETYTFTQVFPPDTTQSQIFSHLGLPAVSNLLLGRSSLIFAYGITSSGKTHTILGPKTDPGLISRILTHVLETGTRGVSVSYYEIYNEKIYDLLNHRTEVKLQQDEHNTKILDLTEKSVFEETEAGKILEIGQKERKVSGTVLNASSSRSHSVFSIQVSGDFLKPAQIAIVDLAGAERTNRTETTGERLKEANAINSSLSVLYRCISVLKSHQTARKRDLVPFRESKLTRVFKDFFLAPDASVMLVLNVNPRSADLEENRYALKFAAAAAEVSTRVSMKPVSPGESRVQDLLEELERKKAEIQVFQDKETEQESIISELRKKVETLEREKLDIEIQTRKEVTLEMAEAIQTIENLYVLNKEQMESTYETILASKSAGFLPAKTVRSQSVSEPKDLGVQFSEPKVLRSLQKRKRLKKKRSGSPVSSRTRKALEKRLWKKRNPDLMMISYDF